ncbi:MAG TPA: AMP-binding protein [Methylomirabilota bacterium]|nr:AMP-binding protein [Methylomirabilota bacterium]
MSAADFPTRPALREQQFRQLQALLDAIRPRNPFYEARLSAAALPPTLASLEEFSARVPFTTKPELAADQAAHPPYGTNLTWPLERYRRCHQTSGTLGTPLRWLDTPEDWEAMLGQWETVYAAAGIAAGDVVCFAFSFGPFIGFWLAFEAAVRSGCRCLPGGGLSSLLRLRMILDHQATVLCCTPTYALHLAETAAREGIDLSVAHVRTLLVAGEPGGSVPAIRARLEQLWPGARVFDHHGMTEVGPVTFQCPLHPGRLHVIESAYFAEIIDSTTGQAVEPGQTGELVLTTLRRPGSPVLRYRTGDLVRARPVEACECGRSDLALEGGILGRSDDMVVVRGVNVYPRVVEEVILAGGEVAEYRVRLHDRQALLQLSLEIEPAPGVTDPAGLAARLEAALRSALSLRVPVTVVAPGALPRFEMKAKRWVRDSAG